MLYTHAYTRMQVCVYMYILYTNFIPTIFCNAKMKSKRKGGNIYCSHRGEKNLIQRHLLGNERHDFECFMCVIIAT